LPPKVWSSPEHYITQRIKITTEISLLRLAFDISYFLIKPMKIIRGI